MTDAKGTIREAVPLADLTPHPDNYRNHPAEQVARMVENSSRPGDGVYEPFSGSGTTLIACEQLGRRCYGIEIEGRYVDVAAIRWSRLTSREPILEATGQTFSEVRAERCG